MRIFKNGDSVELIFPQGVHDLEINTSYKIIDIKYEDQKQFIALEGTGEITNYSPPYPNRLEYHFYNAARFRSDVRIARKNKLKKIWK